MKRFRHVGLYYRDRDGVFRRIPHLVLFIDGDDLVKVYTNKPGKSVLLEVKE